MPRLSVPIGATWKYLLGVGPTFVGFGLDDPPSGADADPAQPGYDDSAWATGVTQFHNDTWTTSGLGGGPTGTIYVGDRIWARLQARTHGGDLTVAGVVDNGGWFFLDGVFITGRNSLGSVTPYVITHVPPGMHTFAFYTGGDGFFDQAGWTIDEGPYGTPPLRQRQTDGGIGATTGPPLRQRANRNISSDQPPLRQRQHR